MSANIEELCPISQYTSVCIVFLYCHILVTGPKHDAMTPKMPNIVPYTTKFGITLPNKLFGLKDGGFGLFGLKMALTKKKAYGRDLTSQRGAALTI